MGICDFVCFIQRNGQFISGFVSTELEREWHSECCGGSDEPSCGKSAVNKNAAMATVVTLPACMMDKISTMPLHEFRNYPAEDADYDWDAWDFVDHYGETGYFDVLQSDDENLSAWIHGDCLYVVFQTEYYRAFVLGDDPEAVGWSTYDEIYSNRSVATPTTKKEAWVQIVAQNWSVAKNRWMRNSPQFPQRLVAQEYGLI